MQGTAGFIDAQSFVAACTLLDMGVRRIHYPSLDTWWARLRLSIEAVVTHKGISIAVDAIIIALAAGEMIVDATALAAAPLAEQMRVEFGVSVAILSLFILDVAARAFALGPRRYWREIFNRMDVLGEWWSS